VKPLARFVATFGPVGYAPIAPATAGSAVVTAIAYFTPILPLPQVIALLIVGTAIAVWTAGIAEETLGHDAKPIVVDEAVGQSLALLYVPRHPIAYIISFVLFRIFDVWKPLGAQQAQRLPGGWGVVADDAIAGLTACVVFQLGAYALRALHH